VLWLPRRGHAREEYEDAFAADPVRGRYAIADGASESSFAARWAQLLVEEFVRSPAPQPGSWTDWLPAPQERWAAEPRERPPPWPSGSCAGPRREASRGPKWMRGWPALPPTRSSRPGPMPCAAHAPCATTTSP